MLSGRLKAVLVASIATTILIGVIGPASAAASPPGLARFMYALGKVESGGNYQARNASGAYGKYQIMPSSWRAWAERYLGDPNAKPTPANQEIVAAAKIRALYAGLQSWRRVAYWWLTGSSRTTGWSSYATRYVTKVMGYYNAASDLTAEAAPVPLRRYSEKNPRVTYTGTWKSASDTRYAGDAVKYATWPGASASFTFTGTKIVWYGPTGRTRGQARVLIDGVLVRTVDLHATTFTARKAVFTRSWASAAEHTILIEVVGTPGHPYVAIDEFQVRD